MLLRAEEIAMQVELRTVATIRPYENNPRQNDAGVEAVSASIRSFGFRQPIVVDEEGVIIVGHTRYKAALKLGLEMVPVHVAIGLTPAQAKAYSIADNQTTTRSQWDDDKLPLELAQLQQMDFDLSLTGFSADELLRLLDSGTNAGQSDPDAVPEPPDEPITQIGDLWQLGKHRLLCGDSSKPRTWIACSMAPSSIWRIRTRRIT
jgi:site-specific DNA-methyltransferase (adenine-specific)